MPWVLWEDPTKPPAEAGAEYGEWIWQPTTDESTFRCRHNRTRGRHPGRFRDFTNTMRTASRYWQYVLTEGQRSDWFFHGPHPRGPRPGYGPAIDNGWSAFALTVFAPIYHAEGMAAVMHPDDEVDPTSITFEIADSDNQHLYFYLNLPPTRPAQNTGYAFVYQINPQYIDTPDHFRRTDFIGGYAAAPGPPHQQPFNVEALWSFSAGDSVHVLVRYHQCLHGVLNYQLEQIAT